MRFPMRLIVAGPVLLCIGIDWLGVRQPYDSANIQTESIAGKIAWQYDTGG
jgi:hypothetical protein